MSEPHWVYRQRRQRAGVAAAMVVGAIAMLVVFGSTIAGGFDLDGPSPVALDRPDADEIIAREKREIDAEKRARAERREAREDKAAPRRKPKPKRKRDKKPKSRPGSPSGSPSPATAPAPAAPAAPAPADPATTPAPDPPSPAPSGNGGSTPQPSNGAVDPRFY